MVVYLVRSYRTYAQIRSLTTGTFNLVVKDRIAFRLSGANSVQADDEWLSSLRSTGRARVPVPTICPHNWHKKGSTPACSLLFALLRATAYLLEPGCMPSFDSPSSRAYLLPSKRTPAKVLVPLLSLTTAASLAEGEFRSTT